MPASSLIAGMARSYKIFNWFPGFQLLLAAVRGGKHPA